MKKSSTFTLTLASMALTASAASHAHTLDLSINNEAVALDYATQMEGTASNFAVGTLHHQDNGSAIYAGLFVADNINKQKGLLAAIGARGYYIDGDYKESSGAAVALGGFVDYEIPQVPNLSVRADLYYAPDVLSFENLSNYTDLRARVQYRLIEQAWVYVGYRNAYLKRDAGRNQGDKTRTLDEKANFGLLIWF